MSKGLDYYNIKIILGNINGHDVLELIEANYKLNSRISGNSHILLLKLYENERDVKKVIFQTLLQLSSQEIKLCLERFNQKSIENLSDNTESLEWFHIIPDQSEREWLNILLHTDGLDPEVKKAFFTLDLLESKKAPESIKKLINDGFFDKDERERLDLIKQMQEEIAKRPVEEVVSQQDVILSEAVEQEDEQKTIFEEIKLIDIIKIPVFGVVKAVAYTIEDL